MRLITVIYDAVEMEYIVPAKLFSPSLNKTDSMHEAIDMARSIHGQDIGVKFISVG